MVDSPQWRGQRDTSGGRLLKLLMLSVLLHVPLTPIAALMGLIALIGRPTPPPIPDEPPLDAIPVDLIADERGRKTVEEPKEPEPKPETAKEPEDKPEPEEPDGEEPEQKEPEPEQKPDRLPKTDPTGSGIGDPVTMAGNASKIANARAHVRLLIFADRIRNHQLGTRIGELLADADQWKDFFGPGGIDPIKDVDRILIAGPQLRNSENVVAIIRHSASAAKMRSAIDALVKRDAEGKWIDGAVPVAHARADRAARAFVLASPRILIVTPPATEQDAIKNGPSMRFRDPPGSEALTTYVDTPWRAMAGVPFEIPKSIKWVRMKITATPDGGATAELVAKDESEPLAKQHAEKLTNDLNKLTQISTGAVGAMFGLGKYKVIEPVTFSAQGDEIHGTIVAKPRQLGTLLEFISKYAKEVAKKNAEKAKAAAAADAGAPAADAGTVNKAKPSSPDAGPSSSDNPYGD